MLASVLSASSLETLDEALTDQGRSPRQLAFTGVSNFRDLGGYPTFSGGQTRWTQVYRSATLFNLSESDLRAFASLGIQTIYDLRRSEECEGEPGPLPCLNLELPSGRVTDIDPATLSTRHDGEQWLFEDYCAMLRHGGPVFGRIFADLSDPPCGPVVFHCTGGKDRTGMTAALLLSALGVDRESVLDDYELTTPSHGPQRTAQVVDIFVANGIPRPVAEGMLSTPRWAMAKALEVLDTLYAGIEGYMVDYAGLTSHHLVALQDRLIE
jgi:protein-tyrosine phosphatase